MPYKLDFTDLYFYLNKSVTNSPLNLAKLIQKF